MSKKIADRVSATVVNIHNRRIKLNHTQEYVARQLGISQNAYSKIEMYQTNLTINRLYEIAAALECTPLDLLG